MTERKQFIVAIVLLALVSIAGIISLRVYDAQFYQKSTITRITSDGISHQIEVYEPRDSDENPRPVVILVHGIAVSKEFFANFAVEFVKLGFIAICPEMRGHGASSGAIEDADVMFNTRFYLNMPDVRVLQAEMNSTYEYLTTRSDVDWNRMGLIGHSMGGGTILQANLDHPGWFKSTVALAPLPIEGVNATNPVNFLLIHGGLDEAFPLATEQSLFKKTLNPADLNNGNFQYDTLYGNFDNGTARKFIYKFYDDHATEFIDWTIIKASVQWTYRSVIGTDLALDHPFQYPIRYSLIVISLLSAFVMIFLAGITLPTHIQENAPKSALKNRFEILHDKRFWLWLIIGLPIGILMFFSLMGTKLLVTAAFFGPLIGFSVALLGFSLTSTSKSKKLQGLRETIFENFTFAEILLGILLQFIFIVVLHLTVGQNFTRVIPSTLRIGWTIFYYLLAFLTLGFQELFFRTEIQKVVDNTELEFTFVHRIRMYIKVILLQWLVQVVYFVPAFILQLLLININFPFLFLVSTLGILFLMDVFGCVWYFWRGSTLPAILVFVTVYTSLMVSLSPLT